MPMLNRLTRLFRADMHAVLDRIEEPELLLRQALREMEEALADSARKLALERTQRERLERRQQEISVSLAAITDELSMCMDADNEALARVLLRRRLEGERLLAHLLRQASRVDDAITQSAKTLQEQRTAFEQLRQQADVQLATDGVTEAAAPWSAESVAVSDADVELALLRERRRRA